MDLTAVHTLLLTIRDREPFIPRIAPNGRVELFFPAVPVSKPGLLWCWTVGEGGCEASWRYFTETTRPTAAEEPTVQAMVRTHYASYGERQGIRLDRDYAALREYREPR